MDFLTAHISGHLAYCEDCAYALHIEDEDSFIECHRHAPRPSKKADEPEVYFPVVDAHDYCGEFKKTLNGLPRLSRQ